MTGEALQKRLELYHEYPLQHCTLTGSLEQISVLTESEKQKCVNEFSRLLTLSAYT
jgi:hypothetical protein